MKAAAHAKSHFNPPATDLAANAAPNFLLVPPLANETPSEVETRNQMIAEAAYFRAEARGFVGGYELEDWLAAEAGVYDLLGLALPRISPV